MIISSIILRCLFLLPLLVIGGITSYSDIKYGKIKNIHLFWGFLYTLFLYFFLILYSYFVIHQFGNLKYLAELLLNGLIAFIFGYLLWRFNLWAAGDAKLFVIYSLLVPLEFYSKNYIPYFSSATLLIDTFIFICFFFLFKMLWKIIKLSLSKLQKIPMRSKRNTTLLSFLPRINYKNLYKNLKNAILKTGKFFLIITCSLITLQYLRIKTDIIFLKLLFNPILVYLFFFTLQMFFLRTFFTNKIFSTVIILSGSLCSLALILSNKAIVLISTIKTSLFLMLFVGLGMQLVYLYIENHEIKKIKIQNLHTGSFLALKSLTEIKNQIKEQDQADNLSLIGSDGLNEVQIQAIQGLFKNDLEKELYIYETFSFAPFMFLSFIFSLITKTSFLPLFSYLLNLIR